jgi:hypothetical protein
MANKNPGGIAFKADTGQMFMLDKKERLLLRELLARVMKSVRGRKVIVQTLGPEYVKVGINLLKEMGGS